LTLVATCLGIASATPAAWAQSDRVTFVHNGEDRHYFITLPDLIAAPPGGVPLVLVLHGAGGNGPNVMAMTGFDEKAEEEGFIAVFPEGTP
jgi:polyhydroxybutyrate depolymerase